MTLPLIVRRMFITLAGLPGPRPAGAGAGAGAVAAVAVAAAVALSACTSGGSSDAPAPPSASAAGSSAAAAGAPSAPASVAASQAPGSGAIPVYDAPQPGSGAASAEPPLPADHHRLPGTNLVLRMPGQVTVGDMSFGGPAFLVRNDKGCEAMVTSVRAGLPRTMKKEKESIQGDTIRWRRFTREEQSPQGWTLEYETDGLSDPRKTAYGFNVRINADGAEVACSRVVATPEALRCGVAACQSIAQRP